MPILATREANIALTCVFIGAIVTSIGSYFTSIVTLTAGYMNYGQNEYVSKWNNVGLGFIVSTCALLNATAFAMIYLSNNLSHSNPNTRRTILNTRLVKDFRIIRNILYAILGLLSGTWIIIIILGNGLVQLPMYYIYGYIIYLGITCMTIKIARNTHEWLKTLDYRAQMVQY